MGRVMTTKINKIIVTFALVICTVLGLANPATVNAKAKVKNIKKTTTITLTKEYQKIDLRKALGKFKKYVTTDESFVKITKKPYDQELYYQKPGVYVIQLAGEKVKKSFKLKAKKGNKKLTLTVKIKDKIEEEPDWIDSHGNPVDPRSVTKVTREEYIAYKMEDEWYAKCINELKAIIATEDTMNDYMVKQTSRKFKAEIPFKSRQILCVEHWLSKRMSYYFMEDGRPCHEKDKRSYEHLYKGTYKGVCCVGAVTEYQIFTGLNIDEVRVGESMVMNHAWCMVKFQVRNGKWVAYGISTPSSVGITCSWDSADNNPNNFRSDHSTRVGWKETMNFNCPDADHFISYDNRTCVWNSGRYLRDYTEKVTTYSTPKPTTTPTATPTSESEAPMDIDEIYYDEDEEEAA